MDDQEAAFRRALALGEEGLKAMEPKPKKKAGPKKAAKKAIKKVAPKKVELIKEQPKKVKPDYKVLVKAAGQGSEQFEEFAANVRGDQSIRANNHNSDFHGEPDPICHQCDNSLPTIQSIFEGR